MNRVFMCFMWAAFLTISTISMLDVHPTLAQTNPTENRTHATLKLALIGKKNQDYQYNIGIDWHDPVSSGRYFLVARDGDGDYYVEQQGLFPAPIIKRVPYYIDYTLSSYPMSWMIMLADVPTYQALQKCISDLGVCHLNRKKEFERILSDKDASVSNICIHDREIEGKNAIVCSN